MSFRNAVPVVLLLFMVSLFWVSGGGAPARAAVAAEGAGLVGSGGASRAAAAGPGPEIHIFPTAVNETHNPGGQVTTDTFTIQNDGDAPLTWTITEDGTIPACDASSAIPWASVDPTGATSAPGGFYTVIVTFDSAGLPNGAHTGTLCVASNDADEPVRQVTLTLNVLNAPEPEINIFPTAVNETHDPGGKVTTDTFTIQNDGDADLTWTLTEDGAGAACDAPSDIPWATVEPYGATSAPGGFYTVIVTFDSAGLSNGTHTGTLCIASNDTDEPLRQVTLTLNVANAPFPEITVFPTAVSESHDPGGQVTTDTFTIQNTGGADLTWTITEDGSGAACDAPSNIGWASVEPTGATSAPGGFYTVIVTFDSTGLPDGTYTGAFCIASNDADEPVVPVTVTLEVVNGAPPIRKVYLPLIDG